MSNYGSGQQQGAYYGSNGSQDYQNGGGPGSYQGYQQQHQGEAGSYYGGNQSQDYQQQNFGSQGYGGPQNFQGSGYGQEPPQYQQYPSAAAHSSNSGRNSHNQGHQNYYGGEGNPEGDRGIMGGLAGGAAGAFGGHALGGKAGHSTSGTIIGAIAGAFTGHKAQDAVSDWKDKRDEKKEWEKQQQQQHQYGPPSHHTDHNQADQGIRGDFGGNFTSSSRDIRLDAHGDYNLHAQCLRADGSYQSSRISLNNIIQNDDGSFRWSGGQSNGASTYTVQQGDTLRTIASKFNHCSFEDLARHNNINNPDLIYPGQNIQIPGGGSRGGGNFGASARNVRLVNGGQRLEGELLRNGDWHQRSIILDERIANRNGCLEFV